MKRQAQQTGEHLTFPGRKQYLREQTNPNPPLPPAGAPPLVHVASLVPTGRERLLGKARWAPVSVQRPSDKLGGEVICPPGAQEPGQPRKATAKDPGE